MQNPFRTEPQAFRFLIATVVGFGLVALAGVVGGTWWGVGVFVVVTAVAVWWFFFGGDEAPREPALVPDRREAPDALRILVVANESVVSGSALADELDRRAAGRRAEVLVVAPALNSPLRHLASDEDPARAEARERLETTVARLREAGLDARGEIGDPDPIQAAEDGFRLFGPDEVVLATHPEGRSHWLEQNVVEKARERFAVPVTHVVVDVETQQDEIR